MINEQLRDWLNKQVNDAIIEETRWTELIEIQSLHRQTLNTQATTIKNLEHMADLEGLDVSVRDWLEAEWQKYCNAIDNVTVTLVCAEQAHEHQAALIRFLRNQIYRLTGDIEDIEE